MARRMAKSSRNRRFRAKGGARDSVWRRRLLAAGGVLVFVLVAGFAAVRSTQTVTPTPNTTIAPVAAIDPSLGPASAPVTLIEYGDFGCTTCRAWEKAGVLKAARQEYGDKLRFVWRDFPVITAESP